MYQTSFAQVNRDTNQNVDLQIVNPLGWEITENLLYDVNGKPIKGWKSLTRDDSNELINICRESYKPLPNSDFFEVVHQVSQDTGFKLEKVDTYKSGQKVVAYLWADDVKVLDYDYKYFISIGNSHDGSTAIFTAFTNYMLRCTNQFTPSLDRALKVYHTQNSKREVGRFSDVARAFDRHKGILSKDFANLANQKVDLTYIDKFCKHMVDMDSALPISEVTTRKQNLFSELRDNVTVEISDLGRNKFGLFNGVTRWTTHSRTQKDKVFGNLFGSNFDYNKKAFSFLLN